MASVGGTARWPGHSAPVAHDASPAGVTLHPEP